MVPAGVGVGVENYRVIFAFETERGGTLQDKPMPPPKSRIREEHTQRLPMLHPESWVNQITKNGLALQLTLQGTKYSRDNDLNNP
jgi:hypothetical protein